MEEVLHRSGQELSTNLLPDDRSGSAASRTLGMKGDDEIRKVFRAGDLTDGAMSYKGLPESLRTGAMTKVRHGAVVEGSIHPDRRSRQFELLAGTVPVLMGDAWVLSHATAVALRGLPMMRDGADAIWVTRPPGSGATVVCSSSLGAAVLNLMRSSWSTVCV